MAAVPSFAEWHHDALESAARAGAGRCWLHHPETARQIYEETMAPRLAKQAKVDETAALRAEVASLRRELAALKARHDKNVKTCNQDFDELFGVLFGKADETVQGVLDSILGRIEALEKAAPDRVALPSANDVHAACRAGPPMVDRGVWSATTAYVVGDVTTHGGGLWIAQTGSKGLRPGDSNSAWRLSAKTPQADLRRMVREEIERQKTPPMRTALVMR